MATILLIEPDIPLAKTYARAFVQAGHIVHHATMAQQAIDLADTAMPDVVVLELQLPAHGGIEFLYEFHSYAEWQHVPIIINTITPPQELAAVAPTFREALSVRALHYKPQASLRLVMRSVNDALTFAAAGKVDENVLLGVDAGTANAVAIGRSAGKKPPPSVGKKAQT